MKATELRIGNLVLFEQNNTEFYVKTISEDGIDVYNQIESTWIEIDQFAGIPLTEEWLSKLGFKNRPYYHSEGSVSNDLWLTNDNVWTIHIYGDNFNVFHIDRFEGLRIISSLKYVHQLQNLYFALTGEELPESPRQRNND